MEWPTLNNGLTVLSPASINATGPKSTTIGNRDSITTIVGQVNINTTGNVSTLIGNSVEDGSNTIIDGRTYQWTTEVERRTVHQRWAGGDQYEQQQRHVHRQRQLHDDGGWSDLNQRAW